MSVDAAHHTTSLSENGARCWSLPAQGSSLAAWCDPRYKSLCRPLRPVAASCSFLQSSVSLFVSLIRPRHFTFLSFFILCFTSFERVRYLNHGHSFKACYSNRHAFDHKLLFTPLTESRLQARRSTLIAGLEPISILVCNSTCFTLAVSIVIHSTIVYTQHLP